jgi:hypothetical protein
MSRFTFQCIVGCIFYSGGLIIIREILCIEGQEKYFKGCNGCISVETIEQPSFVTGLETLQILGVEMSTGGSTESNVMSFLKHFSRFIYQQ